MGPTKPPKTIGNGMGGAVVSGLVVPPLMLVSKGAMGLVKRPKLLAVPMLTLAAVFGLSWTWSWVAFGLLSSGLLVARVRWPQACRPGRDVTRKAWYAKGWDTSMRLNNLMKRDGIRPLTPKLVSVKCGPYFDHLMLHLQPGQTLRMVQEAAEGLAHTYGAKACRVRAVERKWRWFQRRGTLVRVDVQRADALRDTVAPLPIPEEPDLEAVAIGITEYGYPWLLNLLGTHILIGGATGAGKASVLWSIVRGIASAVREGLVELWGIDPKGGQELIHGREMFTRYEGEGSSVPQMAAMLEELVHVMDERSNRLAHHRRRKHEPTVDDPMIVCVIDEMKDLLRSKEAVVAITTLLSRGRSVGITLLMILQDPRKEGQGGLTFRSLIPDGIALRLKEVYEIDAVLGPGAFAAGARCNDIPGKPEAGREVDGRGVAYMTRLGETTPMRVRASFVSDEDLAEMAREYPAFDREAQQLSDADARRVALLALSPQDRRAAEAEFQRVSDDDELDVDDNEAEVK